MAHEPPKITNGIQHKPANPARVRVMQLDEMLDLLLRAKEEIAAGEVSIGLRLVDEVVEAIKPKAVTT